MRREVPTTGYGVSFSSDENVLKLITVMVASMNIPKPTELFKKEITFTSKIA